MRDKIKDILLESIQVKEELLHTKIGEILAIAELIIDTLKKNGKVKTNTGKEAIILDATFSDSYSRIKRGPQIIPLKDIGLIISETGIGKKSKVLDAGTGSGALACMLANISKEAVSYEKREDFFQIAQKNKEMLELKNLKIKNKDVYDCIEEKNLDVIILDLPEPWLAVGNAKKALKTGGFLVSYSPTLPQSSDFISEILKQDFHYIKTCEIIEREWELDGRKIRPKSQAIGHSGFISFCRKKY